MTGWTIADRDILRRIIFQLQHLCPPGDGADRKWQASNGTAGLAAGSLAALLDELDWLHAS